VFPAFYHDVQVSKFKEIQVEIAEKINMSLNEEKDKQKAKFFLLAAFQRCVSQLQKD